MQLRDTIGVALRGGDRESAKADVLAGLTTAAMLVPQAMGYAMLAGLPPEVGLYASLAPLLVYALFGTSRQLAVGPVALDSMIVATVVGGLVAAGTPAYLAIAAGLGVLVGVVQLGLGVARAGFAVNFLSRPVMTGFMSAAALTIAASQLGTLLGLRLPRGHVHELLFAAWSQRGDVHLPTLLIGVVALTILVFAKKRLPKMPAALVVVVLGVLVGALGGASVEGVRLVGDVPGGLPSFAVPDFASLDLGVLIPGAFTIALISFMEAIAVGQRVARQRGYEIDANRELVALGLANIAGGLFGGYPIAGGLSRTAVNDRAGARTQLSALVSAGVVALVLLGATGLLAPLPKVVLASIILVAVLGLVDVAAAKRVYATKRNDFWILALTFVATLALGIQLGLLIGVGASLGLFLIRTTRPHFARLGRIPGTEVYLNLDRHPHAEPVPGVVILRIDAQLYFGNASFLKDVVRESLAIRDSTGDKPTAVVLEAVGVNQLDSSAAEALLELDDELRERGVRLAISRAKGPVRDVLLKTGHLDRLYQEGRLFMSTHRAAECLGPGEDCAPPRPPNPKDPRAPQDRLGCGPPCTVQAEACNTGLPMLQPREGNA